MQEQEHHLVDGYGGGDLYPHGANIGAKQGLGGGLLIVYADKINAMGTIKANGGTGTGNYNDKAGGGGGGGSIRVFMKNENENLDYSNITANEGAGAKKATAVGRCRWSRNCKGKHHRKR